MECINLVKKVHEAQKILGCEILLHRIKNMALVVIRSIQYWARGMGILHIASQCDRVGETWYRCCSSNWRASLRNLHWLRYCLDSRDDWHKWFCLWHVPTDVLRREVWRRCGIWSVIGSLAWNLVWCSTGRLKICCARVVWYWIGHRARCSAGASSGDSLLRTARSLVGCFFERLI